MAQQRVERLPVRHSRALPQPHAQINMNWPRRIGRWLAAPLLAVALVLAFYALVLLPWQRSWGASSAEIAARLPGDELVATADTVATRAITIAAPAAQVWPWLLQMGQGRGGLYSYEALENLLGCDMHNASSIVPALQTLAPGDEIRMYPPGGGPPPYIVAAIYPQQALVLGHHAADSSAWTETWAFVLQPDGANNTRLITRTRSYYADPALAGIMAAVETGAFVMERGMLWGIRERAEREAGLAVNYSESDAPSVLYLGLGLLALICIAFAPRWPLKLALLPAGALLWMAVLYLGHPGLLLAEGLAVVLISVALWAFWPVSKRRRNSSPDAMTEARR